MEPYLASCALIPNMWKDVNVEAAGIGIFRETMWVLTNSSVSMGRKPYRATCSRLHVYCVENPRGTSASSEKAAKVTRAADTDTDGTSVYLSVSLPVYVYLSISL